MGRKAGRRPKYRSESHSVVGAAQDFGPQEIWNKAVIVRGLAAETVRNDVITNYVLRNRVVTEGGVVIGAGTFNRVQCPLDALKEGGFLGEGEQSQHRFEAGEALYELYKNASLEGRTTATWNSAGGGGMRDSSAQDDWSAEDEMRYHRAVRAIKPYDALVTAVCVQHMMPPSRRKAIDALTAGLDLLHAYFARPGTTSSRHEKRVG